MTFLSAHIPFASSSSYSGPSATALPPQGSHLVISDTITSPGRFALYHLVSGAVARKQRVIWVDFRNEGKASLEAVLRKLSVTLPVAPTAFAHIQPSSLPAGIPVPPNSPRLYDENDQATLRATYDAIKRAGAATSSLIILDGLSGLISMGFEVQEINRFVRATSNLSKATQSILISTLHTDHLDSKILPDHTLLESLLRLADGWCRIEGLTSGRSGDVHGEISSHPLITAPSGWPSVPKSQPLQYRLEATTVKVFPKGTGRGYL